MSAEYPPAGGVTSVAGKTGAVSLVKGDVGLGNVDNTADASKPVSTAQQTALDAVKAAVAGAYRRQLFATGLASTSAASGNKYHMVTGNVDRTTPAVGSIDNGAVKIYQLVAAELAVSGLTSKLLVHGNVATANTAPGITITIGLYPITIVAGNLTLGTVVSGSTVAITTPASNSIVDGNSGDFTLPSDGAFALGYIVSGTPSSAFTVNAQLSHRSV